MHGFPVLGLLRRLRHPCRTSEDGSPWHYHTGFPSSLDGTLQDDVGTGFLTTHPALCGILSRSGVGWLTCFNRVEEVCSPSIVHRRRSSVKTGSPARRSSLISWILRAGGMISRRLNSGSFGLTVSSLNQAQHLGGQLRASLRLSGPALSPRESLLPQLRPKGSSTARTADGVTDRYQRTDRSLIAIHL